MPARARPPVAFVRMRACWYASDAISATNFCAASESRRFLCPCMHQHRTNGRGGRHAQPHVLAVEADALEVIVRDLRRDLGLYSRTCECR
jgi:hypothetical protein